ncbi:MAG: hypothetical protein Q9157_006869 [Trypethelium eluteriae]
MLATPAGVDHDYNFLSAVERSFDKAERVITDQGITVHQKGRNRRTPVIQSRTRNLRKHCKEHRIVVEYAPIGMTRQTCNRTYWDGTARCVFWLVEWIGSSGLRKHCVCDERLTLADAYANHSSKTARNKAKKRKREARKKAATEGSDAALKGQLRSELFLKEQPPLEAAVKELDDEHAVMNSAESDCISQPNNQANVDESHSVKGIHFYLHKTHTRGSQTVLIPLAASDTILAALENRIIVEFPTIYALSYPQDQLPSGYVSEADYFRRRRADNDAAGSVNDGSQGVPEHAAGTDEVDSVRSAQSEVEEEDERDDGLLEEDGSSTIEAHESVIMADGTELDQNRLLDILKQDLGRAAKT